MARIEREAELFAAIDRFEDHLGAIEVEGDLSRMHLEREANTGVGAGVQDRLPGVSEVP